MKLKKEIKLSLTPEKCLYPWQILEAEGETWLILRWREKVASVPIAHLDKIVLEDFSWELTCQEGQKQLFSGKIGFKAVYQEEILGQNPYNEEEPCLEEMICENLLPIKWENDFGKSEKKSKNEITAHSSFPAILLDGKELEQGRLNAEHNYHKNLEKSGKIWRVYSPWRCWVKNSTGSIKPVCLKVHLTQVGLYTLVLEVLLKLQAETGEETSNNRNKPAQMPEQKYILQINNDSPAQVLGVAVERAFPRFAYQAGREKICLRYLKRLSLIYLRSREGGERLAMASADEESTVLFEEKGNPELLYPVGFALSREKSEVVLVGDNTSYYGETEIAILEMEPSPQKVEEKNAAVNTDLGGIVLPLPKRCKPCERWLKKGEGNREKKMKTVLTIKV